MNENQSSYRFFEQFMTITLFVTLAFFLMYLIMAGCGVVAMKIVFAILVLLLCAACLFVLYTSKEWLKPRSLWLTAAYASVVICTIVSLLSKYPAPSDPDLTPPFWRSLFYRCSHIENSCIYYLHFILAFFIYTGYNNRKMQRCAPMKDLSLLVWLTQLGISVAVPPVLLIFLASWLRNQFGWGSWVIWVAIALGIYAAITGLVSSVKTLMRLTQDKKKEAPPVAFNEHN